MRVLETIPTLEERRLAALEENARRWAASGTDKQKTDAECVLLAIQSERESRRFAADSEQKRVAAEIVEKVNDKGLFDKVVMAFTDIVPEQWEAEVLKEIAAHPDQHFDRIAHAIGKRGGGYINLAVGTICSRREIYLGPMNKNQTAYSEFLISFTLHRDISGSEWHGWTLKPEADAALRHLKLVG